LLRVGSFLASSQHTYTHALYLHTQTYFITREWRKLRKLSDSKCRLLSVLYGTKTISFNNRNRSMAHSVPTIIKDIEKTRIIPIKKNGDNLTQWRTLSDKKRIIYSPIINPYKSTASNCLPHRSAACRGPWDGLITPFKGIECIKIKSLSNYILCAGLDNEPLIWTILSTREKSNNKRNTCIYLNKFAFLSLMHVVCRN